MYHDGGVSVFRSSHGHTPKNQEVGFFCLTQHDSINDESHYVLQDEYGDGRRTLLCYHASPEANGHLNLNGEQEGWGEWPEERKRSS